MSLVSRTRPLPSAALDVWHHQHAEGPEGLATLAQFCDRRWNVNMTNEIQAWVMIRKFECTWSKDQSVVNISCTWITALPVSTGDHTTCCYMYYSFLCVTKALPEWPDPPFCAGDAIHPVMQYIQCCRREWSGSLDQHVTCMLHASNMSCLMKKCIR